MSDCGDRDIKNNVIEEEFCYLDEGSKSKNNNWKCSFKSDLLLKGYTKFEWILFVVEKLFTERIKQSYRIFRTNYILFPIVLNIQPFVQQCNIVLFNLAYSFIDTKFNNYK